MEDYLPQLKLEIEHIFDSGANEIRIFNMVKSFINKHFVDKEESVKWFEYPENLPKDYNADYLVFGCYMHGCPKQVMEADYDNRRHVDKRWSSPDGTITKNVTHFALMPKPPKIKNDSKT